MKFEWDRENNQANIAKHELDFADVPRVFQLLPRISAVRPNDVGLIEYR